MIEGADLSRTKGLTAEQLAIACGSAETQLPSGLTAPANWPCPDYHDGVASATTVARRNSRHARIAA